MLNILVYLFSLSEEDARLNLIRTQMNELPLPIIIYDL